VGDVVGYGPQPDEVVARLAAENAVGVRGNHDSAAIGELDTNSFNDDARIAVEWTAEHITPETRTWLTALPLRSIEAPFTLVHGSPRDPTWEYVYTSAIARANLSRFDTQHCLVGHTHVPLVFRERKSGAMEATVGEAGDIFKFDGARLIVNPGSVGQPRDGDPRACAMILDTDRNELQWHRVAYPVERTQKLMTDMGLPRRLIARLKFGL
jgi:diadenosine tetraphosphatase ApaH/serine/threonine PP2A family protein phosphatase